MLDESTETAVLLGRDHERDRLRTRIEDLVARRRSASLILRGPRGSGLSALLEAAVADAADAGADVAYATCSPSESSLPFGMVLQLAASVADGEECGDGSLTRPLRAGPAGRHSSLATVAGLCAAFLAAARRRPLLIAVDDAHWADPDSRAWLRAMSSRSNQAPILLLCATVLPCAELANVEELPVRPLPEDALCRLAGTWCRGGPGEHPRVRSLAEASGGLPAVLRAMGNRLTRGAPPTGDTTAMADLAAQVVARRAGPVLDGLSADALRLARAMAACGRAGGFELATMLAAPLDGSWRTALDELVCLGLARHDPAPALVDGVAVRVLGAMAAADRSRLACRAAELGRHSAIADERLAELVVRAPELSTRWSGELLRQVAARRRAEGDAAAAATLLMRALRDDAPAQRPRLLTELALAEVADRPQASDLRLREVLAEAPPETALGELVRAADLLLCRGDARTAHRSIASACRRRTGADVIALGAIGWIAAEDSDTDPVLPVAPLPELDGLPADCTPGPAADPVVEPVVAGVIAWRLAAQGRRRDLVRSVASRALHAPGTSLPFLPRLRVCRALLLAGEFDAALRGLDRVHLDARQAGAGMPAALARLWRAECELARGRPALAAEELAAARRELPPEAWHPRLLPWLLALEARGHLAAGDAEAAERVLEADLPPAATEGTAWAHFEQARGDLRLALAAPAAALPHFLACGRALTSRGMTNPALCDWRSTAAEAHAQRGERAAALALIRDAADRARTWGEPLTARRVHLLAVRSGCGGVTRDLAGTGAPPDAVGDDGRQRDDRQCDSRQRDPRKPAGGAARLSEDEERIAKLAAAGWSNADIARFLAVSTRTVEARLTAIYRRLALTGRKQLAGLFPPARAVGPRRDDGAGHARTGPTEQDG
ncbi:helix-turn-helix transcriptional regulator [Streptomyces sediminimaris]|uniref:helix-turn-helix transcriptional regulator n=1 Tax=Streptomyces sediminimaris TaxID=3383721 RepID=UPI00399A0EB4